MKITMTEKESLEMENYKKKYLEIGIKSGHSSEAEKAKAEKAISGFYEYAGKEKPKNFIWVNSPLEAEKLIKNFDEIIKLSKQKKANIPKILKSKDWNREHIYTYFWGSQEAYWVAYYDFARYLGCKYPAKEENQLNGFIDIINACGWWYPYTETCIISERPIKLFLNDNLLPHCDGGPAWEFSDGFKIWELNGIVVSKEIAESPAELLDPKMALEEKNADVQREIIRKIGYDRILKACNAKTLEIWEDKKTGLEYTMRSMKFGNIDRRYLCYEHASMPGIFYAKCVPPEAKNIVQMRGFQTGVVTREDLRDGKLSDLQIMEKLPLTVQ
jgi:hypothetical protein